MRYSKYLVYLVILILLFSCKKDKGTSDPTPELPVKEAKYTITKDGGTINDKATGVTIEIPKNAVTQNVTFTILRTVQTSITLDFIGGNSFSTTGDIFKIEMEGVDNLESCAIISLPYDRNVSNPSTLGIAYFSETIQKWVPADILHVDINNHKVLFYTAHFSTWTWFTNRDLVKPNSFIDFNTDYLPSIDGFKLTNFGFPFPYNSGCGIKGNCGGFASLSILYYSLYKNLPITKHLLATTNRGDVFSEPYYSSIFKAINEAQNKLCAYNNEINSENINRALNRVSISDGSSSSMIYQALIYLNLPVYLWVSDAKGKEGSWHTLVVYKYEKEKNGTGRFYYYNPNINVLSNKSALYFTHNSDGTINSFEYTGNTEKSSQIFAKYIYAPSLLGGGLSVEEAKAIFDKYFVTTSTYPPTLTTITISNITSSTAIGGGNITYDGGSPVTARGVCWSTSPNPTINNNKTSDGTGSGNFPSNITGLQPDTKYYVRAYATNANGTAYGEEISFTTLIATTKPVISTASVTDITTTTASAGGNITSDGGASVTVRGVCWNTSPDPTIANSKTTNGTGPGSFTSNITGLTPNTKYYVKAYATNANGTGYGSERSFTTEKKDFELSKTSVSVLGGKSESITITSGSGKYGVKSSNTNVATASLSGNSITITGKNEGSVTISVHDSLLAQTKTIAVTVTPFTIVPLSVSKDAVGINVGQSETVSIIQGSGDYTLISGNANIASVWKMNSTTITITGISAGSTSFIIKDNNSGQQVTIPVTVVAMAEMVITPGDITLNVGESRQATVINSVGPYAFIIANTTIASVTQVGNILTIKGLAAGQTTISVRDFGTGQSKVINVTVSGGSDGNCDIYVAGYDYKGKWIAKYWKNGIPVNLTDGTKNAYAYSIHVSGSDIYVLGQEEDVQGNYISKYWKNGVAVNIQSAAQVRSMYIDGSDIYVAGSIRKNGISGTVGAYWKNGNLIEVPNSAQLESIVVNKKDVYTCGTIHNDFEYTRAVYSVNGRSAISLSNGQGWALANAIFISEGDIYVAGYDYYPSNAIYWKNGIPVQLSGYRASTNGINVSNSNVYVVGYDYDISNIYRAKYWQDGIAYNLVNGSHANDIELNGSDVFVVGDGPNGAMYWKNGLPTILSGTSSGGIAEDIFILNK